MGNKTTVTPGRLIAAPENFITAEQVKAARPARRGFMRGALAAAGGLAAGGALAQSPQTAPFVESPPAIPPWTRRLGPGVATLGYGVPSKFESNVQRRISPGLTPTRETSVSFTPLQNLFGIITPSGLHFERHHSGMPEVDPEQHRLMIHGLVKRPLLLTMDDLMRFPSVSRIHFIECGANSGMEWGNVAVPTVQYTHGMLACSEFTGVLLSTLLEEVGYDKKNGRFILAEGADGSALTRTIPIEFALDDVMVVYGQNGEMLRPENGYPLRLVVPGVQGVSNVKWLRRLEVGDKPWNAREETLHYVDLMPDGIFRQYSGVQEVKSVITSPSGGQKLLDKGFYEITGLAWSGRGKIRRVDVSTDGGRSWRTARLQEPVLTKALTRFRIDWNWDGSPAFLQSRAVDETGHVQPTFAQLRAVRGRNSIYHNNAIFTWQVQPNGEVWNVQLG
ncbi:MAG: sulfite dehydrogenase [Burkholderiales bacterium]|jgi:sulfane dehydrogenase subunit SoxC|nr:sulfite dehydrogenase [Burkholderiales bacterium]